MNNKIRELMPKYEICDCPIIDGKPWCECGAIQTNMMIDKFHAILDKHEVCVCPEE